MKPLLALMYHQILTQPIDNPRQRFIDHVTQLQAQYPVVVPGEVSSEGKLDVCLTFDDAYEDFYTVVYPLLKHLNIKAVLAIPTGYIESSEKSLWREPLCTWAMLQEMVDSGLVMPAAHGYLHRRLPKHPEKFEEECIKSRDILSQKLNHPITTFIYPYGKTNYWLHRRVKSLYTYGMRAGMAINVFGTSQRILYRVDAGPFWMQGRLWSQSDMQAWYGRYWWNCLRGR
jgi:peptidoglycan/xylan/chitin deacetylase (PgdA/CDA1 family)